MLASRFAYLTAALVTAAGLAGCDSGAEGEPNVPLAQVWTIPHESFTGPQVTPLNVGDSLVVASAGLDLICVRTKTGQVKWRTRTDTEYSLQSYSLVTDGEHVYSSQSTYANREFRAWDLKTGRLLWTRRADLSDGISYPSPFALYAAAEGALFAGNDNGEFFALEGETGAFRWQVRLDSISVDALTYVDGVLYAGRGRGTPPAGAVSAFDARTGREIWTFYHPLPVWSSRPTVRENEVVVLSDSLFRLDRTTGQVLSVVPLGDNNLAMTVATDETSIYGADNSPWRFDLTANRFVWRNRSFRGGGGYNLTVLGDRVYWANGTVVVLDKQTGRNLHEESIPGGYAFRVATSGGLLIAQSGGGLTAFRPGRIPEAGSLSSAKLSSTPAASSVAPRS